MSIRCCKLTVNQLKGVTGAFRNYSHLTSSAPKSFVLGGQKQHPLVPARFANTLFWEKDRKGGYDTTGGGGGGKKPSRKQLIVDGLRELRQEFAMFHQEWKEKLLSDALVVFRPGETDVVFNFEAEKDLDRWVVTTDKDHNEGFTEAKFELSPAGFGCFHGTLESRVPKDGRIKRSGYANIRSVRIRKSFKRDAFYDWEQYNTLVMRIRGDGRSYLINLASEGYYDILWNDIYHYVLFTRGGPHWQYVRIPFSKFFLASKGRVQDNQGPVPLNRITSVGFSVGARGGHEGQFRLEFDYIGVEYDPNNREEFAYEMYKQPKYIVAT